MAAVESNPAKPEATAKPLPKDEMIAKLHAMPADSTYDELIREMLFLREIRRGLDDADAGKVVSHEEAVSRIRSWRK